MNNKKSNVELHRYEYKTYYTNDVAIGGGGSNTGTREHDSYIIGTHNTMSYLPPLKWYHFFFRFIYRCQKLSLTDQMNHNVNIFGDRKVQVFDIRVRFDEDKNPYFAHGIVGLKSDIGDIYEVLSAIDSYAEKKGIFCYVRLVLEEISNMKGVMGWLAFGRKRKDEEYMKEQKAFQSSCFVKLCEKIMSMNFQHIFFFQGNRKSDWYQLYTFPKQTLKDKDGNDVEFDPSTVRLNQYISSAPDGIDAVQPSRLEKWLPRLYARRYNPKDGDYTNIPHKDLSVYDFVKKSM